MDIILNTFLGPSGLSRAGQEYFRCMTNAGIKVIPQWFRISEADMKLVHKDLAHKMMTCSSLAIQKQEEHIQFVVGTPNNINVLKGRVLGIGSMVQEANSLSQEQLSAMKFLDIVTAPSRFCQRAYLSSGVARKKVFYMPYALDTQRWNPEVLPNSKKDGVFRFLFQNTPYERKGIDVLIRAWLSEFKKGEGVELVIKSYQENKKIMPDILIKEIATKAGLSFSSSAPIVLVDSPLPDESLPGFMKSFDALVSPHRSEGFGMNPWYAMALGVPIIATDYAGTQDFCNNETSWLVGVSKISRPSSREVSMFPQFKNITWAEPDENELRHQMRECYRDQLAREQRAVNGCQFVKERFNDIKILEFMREAIESISKTAWDKLCEYRHIHSMKIPEKLNKDNDVTMLEL